jgi:hypothetical protein
LKFNLEVVQKLKHAVRSKLINDEDEDDEDDGEKKKSAIQSEVESR